MGPLITLVMVILSSFGITHYVVTNYFGQGLTTIPAGMERMTSHLQISKNALTRIENGSFTGWSILVIVGLGGNQIIFVDDSAFVSCPLLVLIYLDDNNLLVPPEITLSTVNTLILNYNHEIYIFEQLRSKFRPAVCRRICATSLGSSQQPNIVFDIPKPHAPPGNTVHQWE